MATFTPIKNQKQTKGALLGTILYAINKRKTTHEGQSLVSGFNLQHLYRLSRNDDHQAAVSENGQAAIFSIVQSFPRTLT